MSNLNRPYPTLKHWRKALRLTQCAAAAKLGVRQGHYSRLERQTQFPRRKLAKTISERTGVPIETVMGIAS